MFDIKKLHVSIEGKEIIKGLSLKVGAGEVHVIMGPNGSGKSTLANAVMGHPKYSITSGGVFLDKKNLTRLSADKRARAGLFLAFQYPKEITGVSLHAFLRTAYNACVGARGGRKVSPVEFRKLLRAKMQDLSLDDKFMNRYVNDGFSGGEKKKVEILQMSVLEPKIAILDEPDSGLDVDALKTVAYGIKKTHSKNRGTLLITHYQRILRYITPNFVHVMIDGRIVKSGGKELAERLEKDGYDWIRDGLRKLPIKA